MSMPYGEVEIGIKANFGEVKGEARELEYLFYRLTSLMGRMGLPKELDQTLSGLQRMILTVRMLHSSLMMLESGTPFGLILGAITAISAGLGLNSIQPRDQYYQVLP
jgi:hypothetical protein